MPSSRRVKLLAVAAVTIILIIFYYNSATPPQTRYLTDLKAASSRERERERLANLQSEPQTPPADHSQDLTDTAGVTERLREAQDAAKKAATEKAGPKPDSPAKVQESMKNRGGSAKKDPSGLREKKESPLIAVAGPETKPAPPVYDALLDIADILKRSPIVIFSKSYCGFSARAKDLLLRKYNITPPPFVVELDKHEHGPELQAALGKQTGRRTVPNIMISGKSIGGCDDVLGLERDGVLAETIQKMGGKRVMQILRLKD